MKIVTLLITSLVYFAGCDRSEDEDSENQKSRETTESDSSPQEQLYYQPGNLTVSQLSDIV